MLVDNLEYCVAYITCRRKINDNSIPSKSDYIYVNLHEIYSRETKNIICQEVYPYNEVV